LAGEPTGLPTAPTQTVNAPTPAISFGQHSPFYDVIEALPPQAAEKLRLLRLRAADAYAVAVPFEEVRAASAVKTDAANALKRLTDAAGIGGFALKPDDQRVIVATKALAKAEDEFRRVQTRQATRAAAFQTSSGALAACEAWLRDGRPGGVALVDVEVDAPKLNKNETVIDAIERTRRRVRELRADLHRIASAPFPSSYAKQQMRAQVAALVQRGAPDCTNLLEHDGQIDFPTMRLQSDVFNTGTAGAVAYATTPDVVGLLAWLSRDALVAALDREIDNSSDDPAALSPTDRELRTSEVMADLAAVELGEAALVWAAMAQQLPVEFRADINPVAVLQIALVTKANGHLPASSPGQSYDIVRPGGGRRR
jgi:hypothetical protein